MLGLGTQHWEMSFYLAYQEQVSYSFKFIVKVDKEKGFGNKEKKNNNAAKQGKFERGPGGRGGAFSP